MKAFAIGGVDYITKPFQMEELHARVETHLKLRRLQIELEEQCEIPCNRMASRCAGACKNVGILASLLRPFDRRHPITADSAKTYGNQTRGPACRNTDEFPVTRRGVI